MARVFKRKDAWWIDYFFEGRRHRQKIGAKRTAEDALAQVRAKMAAGEFVSPGRRMEAAQKAVTFATFVAHDFRPWSETEHAPSHCRRMKSIINKHLLPCFGSMLLTQITTKDVADYKAARLRSKLGSGKKRRPVSSATVNRELCCLKVILKKAAEWGSIDDSPAASVKTSKETPKRGRLLEREEVARLLEEMPDHLQALVACAVLAGLRRSELFHLKWKDVDFSAGELRVVSSTEHPTKNRETRQIPMNAALTEAIRRHPRRLDSPYVFCNKEGKPYDNIRKSLLKAAGRAGIQDGIGLHALRHAFCSHAMMAGADPRTVQKWMGHQDLRTTLRYAHVSAGHEKAAIQLLSYNTWHQGGTSVG
jgi:integrase